MDIWRLRNKIFTGRWVISRHARMRAGQRRVKDFEMVAAISNGEIIEDYKDDRRGHSCLVLGYTSDGRALHAVCGMDRSGTLVIVTVYFPEPPKWKNPRTRGEGGKMIKRCLICGGRTVQKLVTTENWWGDKFTLVENVPALVCERCGERYFEPDVCKELDRLRDTPPAAKKSVRVPVYDFPQDYRGF